MNNVSATDSNSDVKFLTTMFICHEVFMLLAVESALPGTCEPPMHMLRFSLAIRILVQMLLA